MKSRMLSLCILLCGYGFASAQQVNRFIIVDQFGYLPASKKIAVIKDPVTGFDASLAFSPGPAYIVVDVNSGEHVFRGQPVAWNSGNTDNSSGDKAWHFDFSQVTEPGKYYILDSVENVRSYEFEISHMVYNEVLKHAVRTFFYQRAGFAKEAQFAGTGWADGASHIRPLQDLNARYYGDRNNPATERDLSGGWYDAGDFNKYTNWTASYVVEMIKAYIENPKAWSDNYNIPESGNSIPDLLDEVKWGIDHLLRMQEPHGGVLSIVSLSHASPPSSATGPSVYGPATTSASFNTAAAFAISAGVYRSINMDSYADTLVHRAEMAWEWGVANPLVIFNNNSSSNGSEGVGAGNQEENEYGRSMSKLKAACYLFEATQDNVYRDYFDSHFDDAHMIAWSYVYPYEPTVQELLLYYTRIPGATASVSTQIRNVYVNAMNTNSENFPAYYSKKDPYLAHMEQYTWGSNNQKGAQGSAYYNIVQYMLNESKYQDSRDAALGYVHYIHGVNPLNLVYLSNMYDFGADSSVNEFYHTWFGNGSALWDRVGTSVYGPPPGFVPGGPNPSYDWDGCCPGGCGSSQNNAVCNSESISPPKNQPKQKSYKDFNTSWPLNSWSVTENSCGYQVSYIRLLSKFVDIYIDCNGDSAGTALYDICGICSGGNTGRPAETEPCNCPAQTNVTVIHAAACDSFVTASGKYTWTVTGTYTDTLQSSLGCDSVLQYDLVVSNASYNETEIAACNRYVSPSGKVWTESGIYTDTIPNFKGCDSIITVTLNIPQIDVAVIQDEDTLFAMATGVQYRWLDCINGYTAVEGAEDQRFTPPESGSYAVEITDNGCADTSECLDITITGILYNSFGEKLKVFPNPAGSHVTIQLPDVYDLVNVELRNSSGALILSRDFQRERKFTLYPDIPPGIYFLAIRNNNHQKAVVKLVIRP
jgi:endoglucanase